jgi:hypothetical protein
VFKKIINTLPPVNDAADLCRDQIKLTSGN